MGGWAGQGPGVAGGVAAGAARAGKEGKERLGNAEITAVQVDPSIGFDQVGGLQHYVTALKEMVFLPLLYPEVFDHFNVQPPRGVLLYGPPGTGKTLVARALAAQASRGAGCPVTFFMRKGADVLSKWVGEAERQLRLLFEEAQRCAPSIIFFDEIDGLAPVRSAKQDQIHNSIVSTLLALMDGIDARGKVVVIGATNRIDSIDGALRRPGRFDRELLFPLPALQARREILDIHTARWQRPPAPELKDELAALSVGYCGADLKALCAEAALHALRRRYPQIYEADQKLLICPSAVSVDRQDFLAAAAGITPASHRSAASHSRPLPSHLAPLLGASLAKALRHCVATFPPAAACMVAAASQGAQATTSHPGPSQPDPVPGQQGGNGSAMPASLTPTGAAAVAAAAAAGTHALGHDLRANGATEATAKRAAAVAVAAAAAAAAEGIALPPPDPPPSSQAMALLPPPHLLLPSCLSTLPCPRAAGGLLHRPRLLLCGAPGSGQAALSAALLHALEGLPLHALGLPALLGDPGARSLEEALVHAVVEARRAAPALLFLPHIQLWWSTAPPSLRAVLAMLLADLAPSTPLLLLATADCSRQALDPALKALFRPADAMTLGPPSAAEREAQLTPLIQELARGPAPPPPPPAPTGPAAKAAVGPPLALDPVAQRAAQQRLQAAAEHQARQRYEEDESALRALRMVLRDVTLKLLGDRRWTWFREPVAVDEEGYWQRVSCPCDLATILARLDCQLYSTAAAWLADVALIGQGWKQFYQLDDEQQGLDAKAAPSDAANPDRPPTAPATSSDFAPSASHLTGVTETQHHPLHTGSGDADETPPRTKAPAQLPTAPLPPEVSKAAALYDEAAAMVAARVPLALLRHCEAMQAAGGAAPPPPGFLTPPQLARRVAAAAAIAAAEAAAAADAEDQRKAHGAGQPGAACGAGTRRGSEGGQAAGSARVSTRLHGHPVAPQLIHDDPEELLRRTKALSRQMAAAEHSLTRQHRQQGQQGQQGPETSTLAAGSPPSGCLLATEGAAGVAAENGVEEDVEMVDLSPGLDAGAARPDLHMGLGLQPADMQADVQVLQQGLGVGSKQGPAALQTASAGAGAGREGRVAGVVEAQGSRAAAGGAGAALGHPHPAPAVEASPTPGLAGCGADQAGGSGQGGGSGAGPALAPAATPAAFEGAVREGRDGGVAGAAVSAQAGAAATALVQQLVVATHDWSVEQLEGLHAQIARAVVGAAYMTDREAAVKYVKDLLLPKLPGLR